MYFIVENGCIGTKSFEVNKIKLNERDLSLEPPEVQEKFYMLLGKYINKSRYTWKLESDVAIITLDDCEDDPEWLALKEKGTSEGSD